MIRNLKIHCPRCHSTCELYLSTEAPIVILNCPDCWTPMLYNESGVFELSEQQLSDLAKDREFSILNLLEKVASREPLDRKALAAENDDVFSHVNTHGTACHSSAFQVRDAITHDDIIDLRIELATSKDCREFINRL